jgi:hypothetical protein
MSSPPHEFVDFAPLLSALRSSHVAELAGPSQQPCRDIPQATFEALQDPVDFPPLESAIVPGDRVALAVDPNVPSVAEVVLGAVKAIGQTEAGAVDIVVGDEARQKTIDAITEVVGDQANVVVHQSADRDGLRYLAADAAADPIYLNRHLVDADFVLPILVSRAKDVNLQCDLTGVYPAFADSASRYRCQAKQAPKNDSDESSFDTAWLLGVHIMVSVLPTFDGSIEAVIVGTPNAVRERLQASDQETREFKDSPGLVVISLDGDSQQQTWCNASRAIAIAEQHVEPGGVIVLWSEIDTSPKAGRFGNRGGESISSDHEHSGDGFPIWDDAIAAAETIERVSAEHRLLVHCQVDRDSIESLGLGFVGSSEELARLSEAFDRCGVIRAAQFAGTTYDLARHQTTKRE